MFIHSFTAALSCHSLDQPAAPKCSTHNKCVITPSNQSNQAEPGPHIYTMCSALIQGIFPAEGFPWLLNWTVYTLERVGADGERMRHYKGRAPGARPPEDCKPRAQHTSHIQNLSVQSQILRLVKRLSATAATTLNDYSTGSVCRGWTLTTHSLGSLPVVFVVHGVHTEPICSRLFSLICT